VLVGAPLGNPGDASTRLREALATADVIAAEDTRRLRRLCQDLEVEPRGRVLSYFEGNEESRTSVLLDAMLEGAHVLLVTDAGMPSVSDPGYRLVAAAAQAGVPVTAAPGPSAVLAALAVSGLPVDRFAFEGFPPRRPGDRGRALSALAGEQRTLVFFEAPHRTVATLAAMAAAFGGDRRAVVCRELTKTYEEIVRGGLDELVVWAADGVKGEVTIGVEGAQDTGGSAYSDTELATLVESGVAGGMRRKDAIVFVAEQTGAPRNRVYAAAHPPSGNRVADDG